MNPRTLVSALVFVAVAGGVQAAEKLHIVNEGNLPEIWSPAGAQPLSIVDYPATLADQSTDVCVSLAYLIGADGRVRPESLGVLRLWASDGRGEEAQDESLEPYVQAAASKLLQQRYSPTGAAQEVYTSISLAFVGSRASSVDSVQSRCHVPYLRTFISLATRDGNDIRAEAYQKQLYKYEQGRTAYSIERGPAGR